MLQLKVGGEFVDMGDTSVSFTLINPMFDTDGADRAYSYPFNIEASPRNRSILFHAERIDTTERGIQLSCEVYLSGYQFDRGVLTVREVPNKFNCFFESFALNRLKKYKDIRLSDLPFDEIDVASSAPSGAAKAAAWVAHMNQFTAPGVTIDDFDHFWPTMQSQNQSGYNNDVVIIPVDPNMRIPSFDEKVNPYLDGTYLENPPTSNLFDTKDFFYNIIPLPKLYSVLEKITEVTDLNGYRGRWYDIAQMSQLLILNNRPLDALEDQGGGPPRTFLNHYQDTYNLANHLPDITVQDLFVQLSEMFCLQRFETGTFIEFVPKKDILQGPVEDWTKFTDDSFSYKWVADEPGYKLKYSTDPNDFSTRDCYEYIDPDPLGGPFDENDRALRPVSVGSEGTEIDLQANTAQNGGAQYSVDQGSGPVAYSQISPSFAHKMNSVEADGEKSQMDRLRMVFYYGLQAGSDISAIYPAFDNLHPFASFDNFNPFGPFSAPFYTPLKLGDYSLGIGGDYGLHDQWWKEFLELLTFSKVIEKTMHLDPAQLARIREWREVRKKLYGSKGSMIGVVSKIQFTANSKSISPSKVDFYAR